MARYECTLSSELLEKAVTELNEPRDNQERLNAIDKLRQSYNPKKHGELIRSDDAFLLRFLRAKKFKHEKALNCLSKYHELRKDMNEVFDRVHNPELLKPVMKCGVIYAADGKSADGVTPVMYRPGHINPKGDLYDVVAYTIICMEYLLEDEEVQVCGISSVEDLDNFNLRLMTKLSMNALKKLNQVWQDAMPIRFKSLHVIHEGKIYDILYALFKPFMKQKLIRRIKLHGKRYEEIFEEVDRKLLPPYINGTGPDTVSANQVWCERIMKSLGMEDE